MLFLILLFNLINVEQGNEFNIIYYKRWFFYFICVFCCLILELYFISVDTSFQWWINSQFIISQYTQLSKILIMGLSILVLSMSKYKLILKTKIILLPELFIILGFSVLFLLFLTSTNDFFGFYLTLEGLSFTLYILAGMLHSSLISIESAIKYFALGGVSSGIFLFGISWLFGVTGSLNFLEIQLFFSNYVDFFELKIILCFILFGFFFKLSVFPCHWWVADVYEGIWTPITAFFAIVIKAGLFLFFFRLLYVVLNLTLISLQPLLLFAACGSLFIGTFGALKQTRIKRFIAYTSISQVGFIFLGVACCSLNGLIAALLYLLLYIIMSILFFSLLLKTEHILTIKNITFLSDLYSFDLYNQKEMKILSVVLFSMAGIPPLGGFFGKLWIYFSAFDSKLDWVVFLSLLLSLISSYYYLNFVHYLWFVKHNYVKMYYFRSHTSFDAMLYVLVWVLLGFFYLLPYILIQINTLLLGLELNNIYI